MILALILLGLFTFLIFQTIWVSLEMRRVKTRFDYISYCINVLNCSNYALIATKDGRQMTVEEDFDLAKLQDEVGEEAERLGLDNPFARNRDVSS